jgi:hypothetical protein
VEQRRLLEMGIQLFFQHLHKVDHYKVEYSQLKVKKMIYLIMLLQKLLLSKKKIRSRMRVVQMKLKLLRNIKVIQLEL